MQEGPAPVAGYPDSPQTGSPIRLPGPLDQLTAHCTRTNTRISLEPIGYDSLGAPLYAWQPGDKRAWQRA